MPPEAATKPSTRSKACASVPSTWAVSSSNSSGSSSIPLIIAIITGFSQYIEPAGKARSSVVTRISSRCSSRRTPTRFEPHHSSER